MSTCMLNVKTKSVFSVLTSARQNSAEAQGDPTFRCTVAHPCLGTNTGVLTANIHTSCNAAHATTVQHARILLQLTFPDLTYCEWHSLHVLACFHSI